MGHKKGIIRNYCEDDAGYRIPNNRKGKEVKRSNQLALKKDPVYRIGKPVDRANIVEEVTGKNIFAR